MDRKSIEKTFSIVLFIVAVLLVIYAIWAVYYCADDISRAKAAGQLPDSGAQYIIVGHYMSNCAQYFAFALLLAAAGLLLQRKQNEPDKSGDFVSNVNSIAAIDDDDDDDADEEEDDDEEDEVDDADEAGEWQNEESEAEIKQEKDED